MGKTVTFLLLRLITIACSTLALSSNSALDDERSASSWKSCERVPSGIHSPKIPGSNGYAIKISGNPEQFYVPGERYTISLHGMRSTNTVQKFTGFMLVAEPKNKVGHEEETATTRHGVGSFQLYEDAFTMFSRSCSHAIMHSTLVPKTEIQVMWQAPRTGSGCVVFRAMVVEIRDLWYMDDGKLTKELCEQEEESPDQQGAVLDNCCACDEAKYELTFEGLWSRHTHPKDFPNGHRTHFSDIIGASHNPDYRIWEYEGFASEGVHEVAEMGETKVLESELKAQSDKIRTIIKARGLFFPNVTEKTFAVFRVDKQHHVMSLLSMIGPSPDWIVGVSALELCRRNCSWLTEKVLNLYPWDAGTDDGISYVSSNSPTNPPEKIRRITSSVPDNPLSPFYDPTGQPMKPVARLIVTRQRVYENCDSSGSQHNDVIIDRDPCGTSQWTPFTQCSVSCGKGVRTRVRSFRDEKAALDKGCNVKLVHEEPCMRNCVGSISCETTMWSEWAECSASCGKGQREREREYYYPKAKYLCDEKLRDVEDCVTYKPDCVDKGIKEDPLCTVTEWSDWSSCSATCERGRISRARSYTNPSAVNHCSMELYQVSPCKGPMPPCKEKEVCSLPKLVGHCRGYHPRWYYNTDRSQCVQFVYGGCLGNANNFHTYLECSTMCVKDEDKSFPYLSTMETPFQLPPDPSDQSVIDCMLTPWSDWTSCTQSCLEGRRDRRRQIQINPRNGGKPCPLKLFQRRKCKELPPCPAAVTNCTMTQWSEWGPCTRSCGEDSIQTRSRKIKKEPQNGGRACGPNKGARYCVLPPCA